MRLRREIHESNKEIKALGVIHDNLRRDNVLWSEELGRALVIDFHRSTLKCRPTLQRSGTAKRRLCRTEAGDVKRFRVS
jgi:predicted Ser/Thr protein kinase